jgi:hypothetical protein
VLGQLIFHLSFFFTDFLLQPPKKENLWSALINLFTKHMEDLIEINLTEFDPIIGVIYHCFFEGETKASF